ncbi:MAG: ShlB/FhaC/HecB family hemolysin secretion/activation protein [Leptotrichiaceae bacterium]|nr:ShlB/FhaC/HecB family hemolysin secretion/activation protein [Leptotrichiaceae bacterium]
MKKILLLLSLIITVNSIVYSEGRILKNELPKNQKEFFEGDRLIDLQEEIKENGENVNIEGLPKFLVKTITLKTPAGHIKPFVNPKKINEIINEYRNTEINIIDLRTLVKRLNEEYTKKGYITTRVYLEPDQNIQRGVIKLTALEGKIEEIVLDGNTEKDKRKVFFAFTNEKRKVFNISHIDNGIDNLNRVESNNSKISIVPGTKQGYSKIAIESEKEKPIRLILNYENTQKNKQKYKTTLEYDNLLGINDNIYLSYKGDTGKLTKDKKNKDDYSRSYSFGYSFPFKSWSFSLSYNNTKDKSLISGSTSNYTLQSESSQYGVNAGKLLYRNADMKLNLAMGLDVKRERTYIADRRLETQDRNITVGSIGINGMFKPFKGIMSYSLSYSKGIKGFRSNDDNDFNSGTLPTESIEPSDNRYEFGKVSLNLSYYKPFYFKNQGITLRTVFNGQYSKDALFSTEKYSIGDFGTVKGFPVTVSGDTGYSTKIELSYILPSSESKTGRFMYKLRPYMEADFGKVRNNYDEYGEKKGKVTTLSSYSLGVKYYGEKVTLDTGIAKTDKGRSLTKAESHRGYITLSSTF